MLLVSVPFRRPFYIGGWCRWAILVGREEFKWRQPAHHQLWSQQGPHAVQLIKTGDRKHSSGRMVSSGISNVVIASIHSEKNSLKKLLMIMIIIITIIIIIMNKSQELTVFSGRQKLTSSMKLRPEK